MRGITRIDHGGPAISGQPDLLLPAGARLLHIGPHKTGTSAVQSAFHAARPVLANFGVHYAGRNRHSFYEAIAAVGTSGRPGDPPPPPGAWQRLVDEVSGAGARRVVLSSEMFDDADDAAARRVVGELGGDIVHVVVTLRPIARLLPSAWQQYVRNRVRTPYAEWLDAMLNRPPYRDPTPSFWRRNAVDGLVRRWAGAVGPDRLTVIMVDDQDPSVLLGAFERLTGLPAGLLRPEPGRSNRSLTYGEVELFRRINVEAHRQGWSDRMYAKIIRDRFLPALQDREPDRSELRTPTPQWAVDRAAERGAEMADAIAASGVRIVGDIHLLGSTDVRTDGTETLGEPSVPIEAAFDLMMASWLAPAPTTALDLEETPLKQVRAVDLLRVVGARMNRRAVGRVRSRVGRQRLGAIDQDIAPAPTS